MTDAYDIVRAIGAEFDIDDLSDELCDAIAWEETGFPCFFSGDDPIEEFKSQLREFFNENKSTYNQVWHGH